MIVFAVVVAVVFVVAVAFAVVFVVALPLFGFPSVAARAAGKIRRTTYMDVRVF